MAGLVLIACLVAFTDYGPESGSAGESPSTEGPPRGFPLEREAFRARVVPFLGKYCTACHGSSQPKAGLDLSAVGDESTPRTHRRVWDRIRDYLEGGLMPPEDREQPSREEVAGVVAWIRSTARRSGADEGHPADPGRVTIRRLNRAEYNNTIRDLIGIDGRPSDEFPADEVGYGFDNIGDVLCLPPLLMEKYLRAAERISEQSIEVRPASASGVRDAVDSRPASHRRIIARDPSSPGEFPDAARAALERFAMRAYRRPVREAEVARLAALVDLAIRDGESFERGIQLSMQAVLVSPHFLFRVELDDRCRGAGLSAAAPVAAEPIGEFELASRLSYFLWSSMPDDELFRLAAAGKLRSPEERTRQVRRMLQDPKAQALVDHFAGQWLQIRNLRALTFDSEQFPDFDEPLRDAMLRETELCFAEVLRDDRSILDFLDADFTYVNERLARHYGLTGVVGDSFRRVRLSGTARGGLLTHASILTVTSNPNRTSPVKRGKWVLEQLLGAPPPPPPPDVPDLKEDRKGEPPTSMRRRMEAHRAQPRCAACHNRMDPLGFGLENFDGIGAWRESEGDVPIDASGTLPSGESFRGPSELKAILKARAREFARCLAKKLLTYAIGRGLEDSDHGTVARIVRDLESQEYRFSALVLGIVESDPFLKRRQ